MQGPAEPSRQTQQQIVRSENNQKRLNNLLTSAQIIEQKTVQLKSKGVNVSSQQATIQNVITSIQQSGTNVTKQYLAALDNVLNSLRNELKLQKEILVTQKQQNKETKAVTTSEKKQDGDLGGRLSSATIGGFFPLLFGQGPGAALGGAVGGFAGGGKFGFAGSLAGTFAGQATIDFAVNSAVRLGQALRSPTKNIDELTKFLGIAGTQLNTNIKILQALGLESVASAAALAQLEEVLGKEGYKNAEKLAKDLTEVENAFGRLQLAAANALSQPLGQFLDFLADVINQFNGIDIRQGGGRLGRLAQTAESNPPGTQRNTAQTTPPTAQAATEKAISDERARQIRLASEQKRLDQDRLGLTRIELAIRENDITLLQSANELERKRLILKNAQAARDKERVALVQMELDVLEQQREQQEAVKRNAVIEAERAVYRDNANLLNRQFETLVATRNLTADKVTLEKGELAGIIKRYDILEKEFNQRHSILKNQLRLETLGVNEQSIREEILTTYDLQFIQLKEEIDLRRETYKQQYAQYKLTELQTKQALQLQEVQTRAQAQLEIGRARSFSDPQGIGLFGEARRSRNVGIQEYAANVAGMQTQLAAGEEALMQATTDAVNPDTLIQMNNALNIQRQQLALYKELQPQVIQARYEQEKYNEILGYTTQVTNGLFDGLNNVVAGTTSVQEAFGNLLNSIADMLLDFAKQAIVQYIAIGIARTFAGVPPASATGSTNLSGGIFQGFANNGSGIPLAPSFGGFRANGGPVTGGSPYIVGERGPELFVPGRSGTIIPNDRMPTGGGVQVGTINITVENTGEQLSPQAQKQIAGQVRGIVLATLVDQQRGGGVLR